MFEDPVSDSSPHENYLKFSEFIKFSLFQSESLTSPSSPLLVTNSWIVSGVIVFILEVNRNPVLFPYDISDCGRKGILYRRWVGYRFRVLIKPNGPSFYLTKIYNYKSLECDLCIAEVVDSSGECCLWR